MSSSYLAYSSRQNAELLSAGKLANMATLVHAWTSTARHGERVSGKRVWKL
jgi:hypothetical protein